jgi:capsular polysaccharide biosynthesis protein
MARLTTRGFIELDQIPQRALLAAELGGRPRPPPLPAYPGQDIATATAQLDHDARFDAAPGMLPAVRLVCYTVPDAWLLIGDGLDGVVITRDGLVVRRPAMFSDIVNRAEGRLAIDLPEAGHLDDAFVGFDTSWRNYYHWTCFALAKSGLAAALLPRHPIVLPDMAGRDGAYRPANWRHTLALHGLAERSRTLGPGAWRVGALHFLWTEREPPTDILYATAIRAHFDRVARAIPSRPLPRRILIARRGAGARITPDDAELLRRTAEAAGFTTYHFEDIDAETQLALARQATHIIGAHGAGLANLMYAQPGTRVLEINQRLDHAAMLRPWFYQLAALRGQPYMFLDASIGDLTAARLSEAIGRLDDAPSTAGRGFAGPAFPDAIKDLRATAAAANDVVFFRRSRERRAPPAAPAFTFGPFRAETAARYYGETWCAETGLYVAAEMDVFDICLLARGNTVFRCPELHLNDALIHTLLRSHAANPTRLREQAGTCVLLLGPGHRIWGHWLVDFLPKLALLHDCGYDLDRLTYLLPDDAPAFGVGLLDLLGIKPDRLLRYDPTSERVRAEQLLIPTMLRSNSRTTRLFARAVRTLRARILARDPPPPDAPPTPSRVFISRARSGRQGRTLRNRARIEAIAADAGFAIVHPEQLPLIDQVRLFAGARQIMGEYGSALHGTIFSPAGTVVAALRGTGSPIAGFLQSAIGHSLHQPTGYVFGHTADDRLESFSVDEADLRRCLDLAFNTLDTVVDDTTADIMAPQPA